MDFPIELLLSPFALAVVWFYWRKQQNKRKGDAFQQKREQGILADESFSDLLSIEGKRAVEKEKEEEREEKSCSTIRSWE
ncbi:MAG: hypothetical protein HON68_04015 [Gammaproteobacteria bacterium]|jgi:hypothetical protein|nr:hypothetical protein [Gammaproteobacteria bacterium]MBT3489982.1 hypothetical protein [Gammaproteobacteria bacterium]MBT3718180.1 hypothetical protein [Gammaproteobacteria bacterium]MBT3843703.1 hypothetical protein [Gammaproteobacteria bacterium]MBT3894186.1 hypothetical protein [Gammaproteobacteria bacterium]